MPGLGLDEQVVPGSGPLRRVEGFDADVHDARVDGVALVGRQAQAAGLAGAQVLDDDVGSLEEPPKDGRCLRVPQVESQAALVAVHRGEHRADAAGRR